MDNNIPDKALARLLNVQAKLDRATFAADQAQSRIMAIGERLERTGREIVRVTAELDRLQRLRQRL